MSNLLHGLYIGSEALSALTLKPMKKDWTVIAGAMLPLQVAESEDLGPSVKELFKLLKAPKGSVVLALPKQQAIVRCLRLPSSDPRELTQMARFEAERHIPFHAERHATGFHIMRVLGVEGSDVLLGAVDGPVIDRALKGVVSAGLNPCGATLSSVCLVNSLQSDHRAWAADKTIAVVAVGLDTLDLVFLTEGRLVYARSVTMDIRGVLQMWLGPRAQETDAIRRDVKKLAMTARLIDCMNLEAHYGEAGGTHSKETAAQVRGWIDRLIQELRRTYDFARREMKCPPIDAIMLTGEGAIIQNLDQYLYKNLNVEVQKFNPVGSMPGVQKLGFPFEGYEFVLPYGAAIGQSDQEAYRLDLIPHDFYRRQEQRRTIHQLMATGVLLLVTLVLGGACYLQFQDINRQKLAAYLSVSQQIQPEIAQLSEMETKLGIIKKFINDRNSALIVLNAIADSGTVPQTICPTKLQYTKGEMVTIEADAKSIPDINTFIEDLRRSQHFLTPKELGREPTSRFGQNYYQFRLECPLATDKAKTKK